MGFGTGNFGFGAIGIGGSSSGGGGGEEFELTAAAIRDALADYQYTSENYELDPDDLAVICAPGEGPLTVTINAGDPDDYYARYYFIKNVGDGEAVIITTEGDYLIEGADSLELAARHGVLLYFMGEGGWAVVSAVGYGAPEEGGGDELNAEVIRDLLNGMSLVDENYTLAVEDMTVLVDTTDGPVNVALHDDGDGVGRVYCIKKIDGDNDLIVDADGGSLDGEDTLTLTGTQGVIVQFLGEGTWYILATVGVGGGGASSGQLLFVNDTPDDATEGATGDFAIWLGQGLVFGPKEEGEWPEGVLIGSSSRWFNSSEFDDYSDVVGHHEGDYFLYLNSGDYFFYNGDSWDYSGSLLGPAPSVVSKTANYLATTSDDTILVDATSGNLTITLPAVASHSGLTLNIKKMDASANTVTIDANGSETIDGALTQVISAQYQSFTVRTNGTIWVII